MKFLLYAFGDGLGHFNRCLSLARFLRDAVIITNCSYYEQLVQYISVSCIFCSTDNVNQTIEDNTYDCLVVDTFPQGLNYELKLLHLTNVKKVLLQRSVKPTYNNYNADDYDLVLPLLYCNPYLIKSCNELIATAQLETETQFNFTTNKTIFILASGNYDELLFYGNVANNLLTSTDCNVRVLSLIKPDNISNNIWVNKYPAIDYLQLADLVICSGGYNSINEVTAIGNIAIAIPQTKRYDDQVNRILITTSHTGKIALAKNIKEVLQLVNKLLPKANKPDKVSYHNHAINAAKAITDLCQ